MKKQSKVRFKNFVSYCKNEIKGKTGAFMLITKGHPENPTDRSIKSLNKYFQLTNSVGMVYINSDERYVKSYKIFSW